MEPARAAENSNVSRWPAPGSRHHAGAQRIGGLHGGAAKMSGKLTAADLRRSLIGDIRGKLGG